jgi:hypothetical protein
VRIGVDTGGTFTDLVLLDEQRVRVHKVRSTPDDPSRAILAGIRELAPEGGVRRGPRLHCGDQRGARAPWRAGRARGDGRVRGRPAHRAPDPARAVQLPGGGSAAAGRGRADASVSASGWRSTAASSSRPARTRSTARRTAAGRGVEAVAVCLLHSYANPAHERRVAGAWTRPGSRVGIARRPARIPRVRALEHDGRQRVRDAAHGALPDGARVPARRGAAQHHAVERRVDFGRPSAKAAAVQTILSGPAAGARRRARGGRGRRLRPRDRVRHGRHLHRRDAHRRPARHDDRVHGGRLPCAAADHRHPHRGRRRRVDRLPRQRRRAPGWPAERRRRPGPRVLRQGRRADGDRRQPAARPARAGEFFLGGRMALDEERRATWRNVSPARPG